jgi:hypothetical protein
MLDAGYWMLDAGLVTAKFEERSRIPLPPNDPRRSTEPYRASGNQDPASPKPFTLNPFKERKEAADLVMGYN